MSCLSVSDKYVIVVKGLQVDFYDLSTHTYIAIASKDQDSDIITDITISENGEKMGLITSITKQLLIYDLPLSENSKCKTYVLPRSASKIRFTVDNDHVLVADKSGDVLIYNINHEDTGTKLLGHLSLLLDVLQTREEKYIITSDRDEKIRVSCYPNTYNIQTFCLGHKEFVNHIELLPHNQSFLTSTSGDGHIRVWNYISGKQCYSIDTFCDVNDSEAKESFTKAMDAEGIEVEALPIVHYAVTPLDEISSLLAITVYNYKKLLLYRLQTDNETFSHKLIQILDLETFPSAIKCYKSSIYIFDNINNIVSPLKILHENNKVDIKLENKLAVFQNEPYSDLKLDYHESIKVLYKRKFDNVQEYQERKKQRLEKTVKT